MPDLNQLFDAFYNKFLLIDVFGKMIPGAFFIAMVFLAICPNSSAAVEYLREIDTVKYVLFFGFSWIIMFALQRLGEKTGLIWYYVQDDNGLKVNPDDIRVIPDANSAEARSTLAFYYQRANRVATAPDDTCRSYKSNERRHAVIAEATGNMAVSILASLLVVLIIIGGNVSSILSEWAADNAKRAIFLSCVVLIIAAFLFWMHCTAVRRKCLLQRLCDEHLTANPPPRPATPAQ